MKRVILLFALALLILVACATPTLTPEPPTVTPSTSTIVTPTPNVSPLITPVLTGTVTLTETAGRADSVAFEKPEPQMEETNMSGTILELLTAAAFLSLVANRLVQGIATPIFDKFEWDKFWLMYVAWGVGGLLVGTSGVNLFTAIPGVSMPPVLGLVLSALVAGGGSNLMHELFGALGQGRLK